MHLCSHAPIQLGLVTSRAEALQTFWFAVVTGKYFFFGLSVLAFNTELIKPKGKGETGWERRRGGMGMGGGGGRFTV